jgi:hypothetical protein
VVLELVLKKQKSFWQKSRSSKPPRKKGLRTGSSIITELNSMRKSTMKWLVLDISVLALDLLKWFP